MMGMNGTVVMAMYRSRWDRSTSLQVMLVLFRGYAGYRSRIRFRLVGDLKIVKQMMHSMGRRGNKK
jgi:hypothetical protein